MKNILVLGSSGLLGTELISGEYLKKYQLVTQSHKSESDIKLNLEENDEVTKMLYNTNPHVIDNDFSKAGRHYQTHSLLHFGLPLPMQMQILHADCRA